MSFSVDCHKLPDERQALKISTNALIFRKHFSTKRCGIVALRDILARIVALFLALLFVVLES